MGKLHRIKNQQRLIEIFKVFEGGGVAVAEIMFYIILGHINWSKQDVELHQSELPKMPDPPYWRGLTTHIT